MSESVRRQGAIGPGRIGEVVDFQDAGHNHVATTGDFSLIPEEVSSVSITLRDHGIDATTLHSHMLDDSREPKIRRSRDAPWQRSGVFSIYDSG